MAQKTLFVKRGKCKFCRETYTKVRANHSFCSKECEYKYKKNKLYEYRMHAIERLEMSKDPDFSKVGVVKRVCKYCQNIFYVQASQIRRRGGLYCNQKCFKKYKVFYGLKPATLDNLWREAVKAKNGAYCEYCNVTDKLNVHHIFSRTNKEVRWFMDNGIVLCNEHHVSGNFSAHKSPMEFVEWLKSKRSTEWYENLKTTAFRNTFVENRDVYNQIALDLLKIIEG